MRRALLIPAVLGLLLGVQLAGCVGHEPLPGERWRPAVHKVWSCEFKRRPCDAS